MNGIIFSMDFQCDTCSKTFGRQFDLQRHIDTVHGTTCFVCDKCDRQFNRKDNFLTHSRICKLECKYCKSSFEHSRLLNEHIHSEHGDKKFMCAKCGKKYSAKRYLMKHQQKECASSKVSPIIL